MLRLSIAARLTWLVSCAACLSACADTGLQRLESALEVRVPPACRPSRVPHLTVEPLGDFPTPAASILSVPTDRGVQVLGEGRALPLDTVLFRVTAETASWRGAGVAPADASATPSALLMLPLSRECLQIEAEALVPPGAALSLLPDGDILVAGGRGSDALARGSIARLEVVEGRLAPSPQELWVKRSGATAVRAGARVLIIGGGLTDAEGGVALDSFDRYDSTSRQVLGLGRLVEPRREHGAALLADGSVLVVGGRSVVGGTPLATMERIPPDSRAAESLPLSLPRGVWSPTVQVRDDGRVAVVGQSEDGVSISLVDLQAGSVRSEMPPMGEVATQLGVSLPGARLAFFELAGGRTTGALWLMLPSLELVRLDGWLTDFGGLCAGRAVALRDGRVLLTGARGGDKDCRGGLPEAYVLDIGRAVVARRQVTHLPEHLLLRDDGSVVQLGADHMAVRREDRRTRYDNPGSVWLVPDNDAIALDRPGHWRWRGGAALEAQRAQARVELPTLRYADARFELEAEGAVELLLWEEGQPARALDVSTPGAVGPALCTVDHAPGDRVVVERRADRVTVRSGAQARGCLLAGLEGSVAVALRAREQGSTIRFFSVTRLP